MHPWDEQEAMSAMQEETKIPPVERWRLSFLCYGTEPRINSLSEALLTLLETDPRLSVGGISQERVPDEDDGPEEKEKSPVDTNPIYEFPEPIWMDGHGYMSTLRFDAKLEYRGMEWLRVYNGFGGEGRREDWVLRIPCISVSINRYGDKDGFGFDGDMTREQAMDRALQHAAELVQHNLSEKTRQIGELGIARLQLNRATGAVD